MKYVINPFTPIPVNPKSHVRGWAEYWASTLDARVLGKDLSFIKSGDTVYIDHGVNFSGSLNLFGGVDEGLVDRLKYLIKLKIEIVSLDIVMPHYAHMLAKRIGQNTCSKNLTQDLIEKLGRKISPHCSTVTWRDVKSSFVCIGDSHATAFARKNSTVYRSNGKTLRGLLKNPGDIIPDKPPHKFLKGVTLCFGSVDIRHHILRQKKPHNILNDLINSYLNFGDELSNEWNVYVEYCVPVPIEFIGRKIPKSGWYEGTPYFGTLDERRKATWVFQTMLRDSGQTVVMPPTHWYNMDPEEYAKTYMELGSSVHISPQHYRSKGGWNV